MNDKELLGMAQAWRKAALENLVASEIGTLGWASAEMLLCCADMIVWKVRGARDNLELRI